VKINAVVKLSVTYGRHYHKSSVLGPHDSYSL
jgi:hypothetical protein